MFYQISQALEIADYETCLNLKIPFVGVLTSEEYHANHYGFDFENDLDMRQIHNSKLEVNLTNLSGTLYIPDHSRMDEEIMKCAFVMDKRGILFIDDEDTVMPVLEDIRRKRQRMKPSLERFVYDFLENIIEDDLMILEAYADDMELIERHILAGEFDDVMPALTHIRNELRTFWMHYEQLFDFGEKLEENENEIFDESNLRYFQLFEERVDRRQNLVSSLRDHTSQIRDLYQSQLDMQQNNNMNYLTIVTTIFLPLTLVTGWYGMNFRYMPELAYKYSYLVIIVLCILIIAGSLWFFKKKKLL